MKLSRRTFSKLVSLSLLSGVLASVRQAWGQMVPFAFWRTQAYGEARTTQVIAKVLAVGGAYDARTTQVVAKVLAVGGAYDARTTQVVAKVLAVGGDYEAQTTQVVVKVLVIP